MGRKKNYYIETFVDETGSARFCICGLNGEIVQSGQAYSSPRARNKEADAMAADTGWEVRKRKVPRKGKAENETSGTTTGHTNAASSNPATPSKGVASTSVA